MDVFEKVIIHGIGDDTPVNGTNGGFQIDKGDAIIDADPVARLVGLDVILDQVADIPLHGGDGLKFIDDFSVGAVIELKVETSGVFAIILNGCHDVFLLCFAGYVPRANNIPQGYIPCQGGK